MDIQQIRKYAPYVYLAKDSNTGLYSLYLMIFHHQNIKVTAIPGIENRFAFRIEDDQNSTNTRFEQRIPLNGNVLENPLITVDVLYNAEIKDDCTKNSYKTAIHFEDADLRENLPGGNIAYNCPYVYLTNPNAETGDSGSFTPRCYVPLQDFDYDPVAQRQISRSDSNVSCIQEIKIFSRADSIIDHIDPADININNDVNKIGYTDPQRTTGYFAVILIQMPNPIATASALRGTPTLRKGVIRNVSSDTNPSGFLSQAMEDKLIAYREENHQ